MNPEPGSSYHNPIVYREEWNYGYHCYQIKTVSDFRIGIGERRSFTKQDVVYITTDANDARTKCALLSDIRKGYARIAADNEKHMRAEIDAVLKP